MFADNQLEIKNLNVYFDNNRVLKNINFKIPNNKVTVIIGPSGCGKTTLLKSMNRLLELTQNVQITGTINLDGIDIYQKKTELSQIRKKMGLLSQKPYPFPMSIFNNVAYGMKIHGLKNKKKLTEKVEHYLTEVSLWNEVKHKLDAPATALSIGQQQRLCLARCLSIEPEIILCDEPTSALDPVATGNIENKIDFLKNKYTFVIVTHILRQAKRIADYILFVYNGELIEHGATENFFGNPQHKITRNFIQGVIS